MRSMAGFVLVLVLLGVGGAALAADATLAAPKKASSDPRLEQLVTVQCTGVRLHTALDRISAATGVKIFCGRSRKDWKSRDLPVIVCVKDMPLGKLLKDIAVTTRLFLGSETLNDQLCYRIFLDSKREKELDDYFEGMRNAQLATASWDCTVAARFKDFSESDFNVDPNKPQDEYVSKCLHDPMNKDLSIAMAALSKEDMARAFAGEQIQLTAKDAPDTVKNAIRQIRQLSWQKELSSMDQRSRDNSSPPDQQTLDNATFRFTINTNSSGGAWPSVSVDNWNLQISDVSNVMSRLKSHDLPQRPRWPQPPKTDDLDQSSSWLALDKWLDNKVKLEAPPAGKELLPCDLLAALSKAADVNVIGEDFGSFFDYRGSEINGSFGKELQIRALPFNRFEWRSDDGGKTLIGADLNWTLRHRDLMPEAIYKNLVDKGNSTGVELEDALPLTDLNENQINTWLSSKELSGLQLWFLSSSSEKPLWQLYYHLTPAQQAQAATDDGLPLGALDPQLIIDALLARAAIFDRSGGQGRRADAPKRVEEELAADSQAILGGVLHFSNDVRQEGKGSGQSYPRLRIEATSGDKKLQIDSGYAGPFPIYTPKRWTEMDKMPKKPVPLQDYGPAAAGARF